VRFQETFSWAENLPRRVEEGPMSKAAGTDERDEGELELTGNDEGNDPLIDDDLFDAVEATVVAEEEKARRSSTAR